MPELAEVEYYRRQWDCGLGEKILKVALHPGKRIFRGSLPKQLATLLPGQRLDRSEACGKQLMFRFSGDLWLGLHLGMTGKLLVEPPDHRPGTHDHLVLFQSAGALVFNDSRLFGRVRFTQDSSAPSWWANLPPAVDHPGFGRKTMETFLDSHRKIAIKPALLLQSGFPGIGNWMADEILWLAKINPLTKVADLDFTQRTKLWKSLRSVVRGALRYVSPAFSDPPAGWLFHERWSNKGQCPIHHVPLTKRTVGGRSTAWCPACQP